MNFWRGGIDSRKGEYWVKEVAVLTTPAMRKRTKLFQMRLIHNNNNNNNNKSPQAMP